MAVLHFPSPREHGGPSVSLDSLRRSWHDAVAAVAPHLGGLTDFLDEQLAAAGRRVTPDEAGLLGIIDGALRRSAPACAPAAATALDRRLRRAAYEYLLAVDAASPQERAEPVAPPAAEGPPGDTVVELPPRVAVPTPAPPAGPSAAPPPPPAGWNVVPREPAPRGTAPPPARSPGASDAGSPPGAGGSTPAGAPATASWRVRERTPAGNRQTADRTALADARQRIDDWLQHRRSDDAAALVQQLAQEAAEPPVVQLALDTGDRCRTLGRRIAATSCYVAALRADPLSETALARLAELCIDDQEIDLAVAHLERIAQLARLRGDEREAMRVTRRIVTIAPDRDDLLGELMRAHLADGSDR